jgi:hypothetical protein
MPLTLIVISSVPQKMAKPLSPLLRQKPSRFPVRAKSSQDRNPVAAANTKIHPGLNAAGRKRQRVYPLRCERLLGSAPMNTGVLLLKITASGYDTS